MSPSEFEAEFDSQSWLRFDELWSSRLRSWLRRRGIGKSHDREDIIQDVCVRVHRSKVAQDILLIDGIVWKAANQSLIDYFRRANHSSRSVSLEDNDVDCCQHHQRMNGKPLQQSHDKTFNQVELREVLEVEIERLPAEDGRVVRRYYLEGETQSQIAASLGVVEGTLCKRLKLICRHLSQQISLRCLIA